MLFDVSWLHSGAGEVVHTQYRHRLAGFAIPYIGMTSDELNGGDLVKIIALEISFDALPGVVTCTSQPPGLSMS